MNNFFTLYKETMLNEYVAFSGRADRKKFWTVVIINSIIGSLLGYIFAFIGVQWLTTVISVVWWLIVLLPTLGVSVRRLHDVGKNGWNLLWFLLPLIGQIILLIQFLKAGDPAANKYGEPVMA